MEHDVYICSWKQSVNRFEVWVTLSPALRGCGATYGEAERYLIQAIQRTGGAMQAVLEHNPPLPKSVIEKKYGIPEIYIIGGDDRFETDTAKAKPIEAVTEREARLREIDTFFQSSVCRKCEYALSPRSDKPLSLAYAPPRYDGAFGFVGNRGTTMIQIVSHEFLGLLTSEETKRLEFRPILRSGRARKFYELLGPKGPPLVAVTGLKASGWRCSQCGHRTWGYWLKNSSINRFVASSDLPPSLNGIFTIGTPPEIHLVTTMARWKDLAGRNGTRGFVSRLVGVAPEHEVIRVPELKTYEECLREAPK